METLLTNPSITCEFQISTLKLLIYNFVIVLIVANQNVNWNFKFRDIYLSNRLGHELFEPTVLTKFGFCFRFATVIMNLLAVATVLAPKRENRNCLLPCILWNFYTITAVAENMFEIIWSLVKLEVPFAQIATILLVGVFMIAFQTKLTLQVIRFYEYLNYVHTQM